MTALDDFPADIRTDVHDLLCERLAWTYDEYRTEVAA